eukprot:CAMPEP_0118970472 /NCGR_PEP_ID=MMETSP1173-20130426/7366_1 /TAXON_ID=1034831 /ORGANISM="Rhizochromulina marina cf, Strain CCMP1243" /LENGTH=127 /DNA_ID=CAMNT_0006919843 /DNA_START=57 /DNA_END=440 /DNA_ORIENTATION=+
MKLFGVLSTLLVLGMASAFTPSPMARAPRFVARAGRQQQQVVRMAEDTYWEGKAPPSTVLGPVLSKTNSGLLGLTSLAFLAVGSYCAVQNNLFSLPDVNPLFVLGANLLPISWGLHVASWIQKENGK